MSEPTAGDVGDVEGVSSRVEGDFRASPEGEVESVHARVCREAGDSIPKIPNIPKLSATDCNESTEAMGMLDGNIPTTSPNRADIPKTARTRVDLADFGPGESRPPHGRRS